MIVRNVIDELRRYTKHDAENLERVNAKFFRVSQEFVHGEATEIVNPWYPSLPTGFMVTSATDSTGAAIPAPAVSFTAFARDGWSSLTMIYAPPANRLQVTKSVNQTGLISTAHTLVTWDVTGLRIGTFDYTAAGVFTAPATGILEIGYTLAANAVGTAAGDYWGGYAQNTSAGSKRAATSRFGVGIVAGGAPIGNARGWFAVTAGDQLEIRCTQGNAAGTTRDLSSGAISGCVADLFYSGPPADFTGTVTGYLLGP